MVFTAEQVGDEPIVLLKITFPIEDYVQETIDSDAAVAKIGEKIEGKYYRIADMRQFQMDFSSIVEWLGQQRQRSAGSINDERVISLLVSSEENTIAAAKFAGQEQYGGKQIKIFSTVEDAIAHARKGEERA